MRLFCFPYAGGRALIYRELAALLPGIELRAVELPGRGTRLHEPALASMQAVTDLLLRELDGQFDRPFAFYGHSMGAAIAYELARRLPPVARARLRHVFLSACRAPEHFDRAKNWHGLGDAELLQVLRDLGGTPPELLNDRELMAAIVLPMMRADFAVIERYQPDGEGVLAVPITALVGREDARVPAELVADWRRWTSAAFELQVIEGGHFFLWQAMPAVAALLKARLDAGETASARV